MLKAITLFILLSSTFLFAQKYALVIGINQGSLLGAKNDAMAMSKLLKSKRIEIIYALYDEEATKKKILNTFNYIVNNATSNDQIYIFFSGHGTNFYDPNIQHNTKLKNQLKDTSALIPWDVSPSNYGESIIIVKRDLAPLFRKLDKQHISTLVMIDACFSGAGYKSFKLEQKEPLAVSFYEERSSFAHYPYKYITYISGATRSDFSVESPGKKRGYFSLDIDKCLRQYDRLNLLRDCMKGSKLPVLILPSNGDKKLF